MKAHIAGFAAAAALLAGAAGVHAQDSTTVIHEDSAPAGATVIHEDKGHHHSKTVIERDDGSKTVIKRHGDKTKQVDTTPAGDRTVTREKVEH